MVQNIIFTLGWVLLGGLITWFYYQRSGNELATEAARLRRLSTIILNIMEDAGFVELNRADSGEIQGRVIPLSVTFESGSQMCGELDVIKAQKNRMQPDKNFSIYAITHY